MSSKESTTININVSGGNEKPGDIYGCPRPWPWPIPFPFPPYPFPFPFPFPGGGPLLMTEDFGRKADQLSLEGIVMAANLDISKGFEKEEMDKHLRSKVLPKLIKATSLEEVNEVMSKTYKAFPEVKEFIQKAAKELSNGNNDKDDKEYEAAWIWWLIRIILALLMMLIPSCAT